MLSGPKGSGKTSIAERIPSILPDLTREESLELTAIHSLAGALEPGDGMLVAAVLRSAPRREQGEPPRRRQRRRCVPASSAGPTGALPRRVPAVRADVIEALRQPLESGEVTVARRDESVRLPARGMLVLACNPCPCGDYPQAPANACTCPR